MNKNKLAISIIASLFVLIILLIGFYIFNSRDGDIKTEDYILYNYIYNNNQELTIKKCVIVPKKQDTTAKIAVIIEYLESTLFDQNRVDFTYEETTKRLIINLNDDKANTIYESKWNNYFQGSSGAEYTYKMLMNNIFQFEKKDEWIKEIEVQFNNRSMPEMDHINLSGVITRNSF